MTELEPPTSLPLGTSISGAWSVARATRFQLCYAVLAERLRPDVPASAVAVPDLLRQVFELRVVGARFEQQYRVSRVFRQAGGDNRARGPGPDDDRVVNHACLSWALAPFALTSGGLGPYPELRRRPVAWTGMSKRARLDRQSRLLAWSARTTPVTVLERGRTTSNGYPLTWDVMGQSRARLVLSL